MKSMLRAVLALWLILAACVGACEQAQENPVVATVNGEALYQDEYAPVETSYLTNYAAMGVDVTDEAMRAYVQDLALTAAIEQMLVRQDMQAQGFLPLDAESEQWAVEQGTAAYEQALDDVGETLRDSLEADEQADMSEYALGYAQILGVTVEDYIDVYRTQLATVRYYDWLTADWPVTDEDVRDAFSGDGEITQEQHDELAAQIYQQRCQERLSARVD